MTSMKVNILRTVTLLLPQAQVISPIFIGIIAHLVDRANARLTAIFQGPLCGPDTFQLALRLQGGIVTPTEALCTPHSSGQAVGLDAEEPVNTVITRSCPAALKRRGH